jgi:hypothetical protein
MTSVGILLFVGAVAATPPSSPPQDSVEVRGRAACLDRSGHSQQCVGPAPHRFALATPDGPVRPFVANDQLANIFEDPRVREKDLLVRAREAATYALEIIKVFSVRDGKVNDLRYYCDICHINAYVPGPCPCCGREMELVEEPLP